MQTVRCIWARLYCLSCSSTVRLSAHLCPLAPLWISIMWKESASRQYGDRSWANSDWRVLRSPWDRAKSPIKFKHCITAPRSYWRSSGGIGRRVAVRTARKQSITPRRYTNSTWSTVRRKAVSIATLSKQTRFFFLIAEMPTASISALCAITHRNSQCHAQTRRDFKTPGLKCCSWKTFWSFIRDYSMNWCFNNLSRDYNFVHMRLSLPALAAQQGFKSFSQNLSAQRN